MENIYNYTKFTNVWRIKLTVYSLYITGNIDVSTAVDVHISSCNIFSIFDHVSRVNRVVPIFKWIFVGFLSKTMKGAHSLTTWKTLNGRHRFLWITNNFWKIRIRKNSENTISVNHLTDCNAAACAKSS